MVGCGFVTEEISTPAVVIG